ncbi:MAG: PQQ-dependent sugar dehydrogenase, partial [Flavisolibacter sp.]|nr:PQQ-dependent sugar dehydrogenase [Flavisolibacter sp.]
MINKVALCFFLGLAFACQSSNERGNAVTPQASASDTTAFKVVKLYEGLSNPWGMAWLPDGRLLVTERAGEILVFEKDKYTGQKLDGVPAV